MAPRTEFIVLATLAGGIVAVLGYLLASAFVFELRPLEALRLAAQWSPAGIAAAFAAAWIASAWQRRAREAGRAWTARAMALRATGLALLLYPLTVACWTVISGWLDQRFASAGMPLRELMAWVPSIVLGATLAAVLIATLPAFVIAFLLCRRYLRRQTGFTTGIA